MGYKHKFTLAYLWFEFFKLNDTYKQYCIAQQSSDTKAINTLNEEHPQIAELFSDWGDIHGHYQDFAVWQKDKLHLLIEEHINDVTLSKNIADIPDTENTFYLQIPRELDKKDVIAQTKKLIDKAYKEIDNKKTKYTFSLEKPKSTQLEHLYKCLVVALKNKNPNNKNLDTVRDLYTDHISNWGAKAEIEALPLPSNSDDCKDETSQIRSLRRDGDLIINNTLIGKFPIKK